MNNDEIVQNPPEEIVTVKAEGRRDEVERLLNSKPTSYLEKLAHWKQLPDFNRQMKRRKAALARKLVKDLPAGVTLTEAAMVV